MAIMKQMQECLDKAFTHKLPAPSKKWKAFLYKEATGMIVYLYHYQHLILVYDVDRHEYIYEWWEKPTDKRGLDSAKQYMEERHHSLQLNQNAT